MYETSNLEFTILRFMCYARESISPVHLIM